VPQGGNTKRVGIFLRLATGVFRCRFAEGVILRSRGFSGSPESRNGMEGRKLETDFNLCAVKPCRLKLMSVVGVK